MMRTHQVNRAPQPITPPPQQPQKEVKPEWTCPVSLLLVLICISVVATILFTFTMTSEWVRKQDGKIIAEQQQTIDALRDSISNSVGNGNKLSKLDTLASLLEYYSYYTNEFNKEEMLDAALRAYVAATGDKYAAYYTEEEYAAIRNDKAGEGVGLGVSVTQEPLTVGGQTFLTFHITAIFKGAPAENSNLRLGDRIYAIEIDGEYKNVEQLGGYIPALSVMRGEVGTVAKLLAFRTDGNGGFPFPRGRGVDCRYQNQLCLSFRVWRQRKLCFVFAVLLYVFVFNSGFFRDLGNGAHRNGLGNFNITQVCHLFHLMHFY